MTKVKLKNGLRVVNFSSPHDFKFTDGTVLSRVDCETVRRFSVKQIEKKIENSRGWVDVEMAFELPPAIIQALDELEADSSVDIVLVSFPTLTAIKASGRPLGKARVCKLADRVSMLVCVDQFCI